MGLLEQEFQISKSPTMPNMALKHRSGAKSAPPQDSQSAVFLCIRFAHCCTKKSPLRLPLSLALSVNNLSSSDMSKRQWIGIIVYSLEIIKGHPSVIMINGVSKIIKGK